MSGVITTGSFPRELQAGIKNIFNVTHKSWDPIYSKIFEMASSDKAYEVSLQRESFGLVKVKGEGSDIEMDSARQAFSPKYVHVAYGLGFVITREAKDDNQYGLFADGAKSLARSFAITKEINAHVLLNTAFAATSAMPGGDGIALCSTTHINGPTGGTYSNRLTVGADFSEASIEDMMKQVMRAKDDRNKPIRLMAKTLIGHTDQAFEFERVMNSVNRSGTANNDINAVKSLRSVANGYVLTPYLDANTRSWFLQTDADSGLKGYDRTKLEFDEDKTFLNQNTRFAGYERYSFGYGNPRALFGSNGN